MNGERSSPERHVTQSKKLGIRLGRWSFTDSGKEIRAWDNDWYMPTCGFVIGWRGERVWHPGFKEALAKAQEAFAAKRTEEVPTDGK
jgi:hypothetical protein